MLCLISYYNVRKLSRQSVLTPVSFTAHGHMFALPSFSEPIASFGRLKPRVSRDENVDLAPILLFPACSRNIMALWRKTFVTEPLPGAVIRCFISRQLVSAWKWSQMSFLTTPPPFPTFLPITAFLSLASLHVAQTTTHHPESKHFTLLLLPF